MDKDKIRNLHPADIRKLIREGEFSSTTEGCADGYAQANLVILPEKNAFDFLLFCQRNPKPCPILEVTEAAHAISRGKLDTMIEVNRDDEIGDLARSVELVRRSFAKLMQRMRKH